MREGVFVLLVGVLDKRRCTYPMGSVLITSVLSGGDICAVAISVLSGGDICPVAISVLSGGDICPVFQTYSTACDSYNVVCVCVVV